MEEDLVINNSLNKEASVHRISRRGHIFPVYYANCFFFCFCFLVVDMVQTKTATLHLSGFSQCRRVSARQPAAERHGAAW